MGMQDLFEPLSDADFQELAEFLHSDASPESCMDISALHGFLTAVISGPMIPPSEWLPKIWGNDDDPAFAGADSAERIIELVMRLHNDIAGWLEEEPDGFEPVFIEDRREDPPRRIPEPWCEGYLFALNFRAKEWIWLKEDPEGMRVLTPIALFAMADEPEVAEVLTDRDLAERVTDMLGAAAVDIFERWREHRRAEMRGMRRAVPKISPNAACPCGSGKKYKRCCRLR